MKSNDQDMSQEIFGVGRTIVKQGWMNIDFNFEVLYWLLCRKFFQLIGFAATKPV
jgi:hypothetical protein